MKKTLASLVLLISLFLFSCGEEGPQLVPIEGLTTYEDESLNFKIDYPKNWAVVEQPGKQVQIFSIEKAKSRFARFDTQGEPVARISFSTYKMDSTETIDSVYNKMTSAFAAEAYSAPTNVKIDGTNATKVSYGFPLSDGNFDGIMYVATKDNKLANIIKMEAFAGGMEKYKADFDKVLNSIVLATQPQQQAMGEGAKEELPPPSSTLKSVKGQGFTIQIPENFDSQKKGARYVFSGERRGDSYISVDYTPMKESKLEETAKKTAGGLGISDLKKTKIGGKTTYYISYSPNSKIHRDIYFYSHSNKLYRVIVDYATAEADLYKSIFNKSAKSIKFN